MTEPLCYCTPNACCKWCHLGLVSDYEFLQEEVARLRQAILETIARADDYADSYISRPIRDCLQAPGSSENNNRRSAECTSQATGIGRASTDKRKVAGSIPVPGTLISDALRCIIDNLNSDEIQYLIKLHAKKFKND